MKLIFTVYRGFLQHGRIPVCLTAQRIACEIPCGFNVTKSRGWFIIIIAVEHKFFLGRPGAGCLEPQKRKQVICVNEKRMHLGLLCFPTASNKLHSELKSRKPGEVSCISAICLSRLILNSALKCYKEILIVAKKKLKNFYR